MENLRGEYGDTAYGSDGYSIDDESTDDVLLPQIGADERRLQVRAYNFWASMLGDRAMPHVDDLDPNSIPDFGPNGVLLDFSHGIEDPAISFLGERLAEECDADASTISRLSDVPARSLLSRITDHYMQILANQAPIGFEAEFVNQRIGLAQGMLADFLRKADGGLKGVVHEERRLRRTESGKPVAEAASGPRKSIARKLRAMDPRPIAAIDRNGDEFALVMVRRTEDGEVVLLGEVPRDVAMVERAARSLLG